MPGLHTTGSTNCVFSKLVLSCGPGMQRATYRWGAWYSSGTDVSPGKQPSLAGTSGASSASFVKFFVGGLPPILGSMWSASALVIKGPSSAAICVNSWVCDDPGNLPAASSTSNFLFLLLISSCEGGVTPEATPSWGPLLLPALGIIFVLAIWNGLATNQRLWQGF